MSDHMKAASSDKDIGGRASSRIAFLDGLRCLAIAAVVFCHYFAGFSPNDPQTPYPYGDLFDRYFQLGYYGVQLFFIVSGFVISLTLYRCANAIEFVVRRFARLWPSMLLCSVLTFVLTKAIHRNGFDHHAAWFIPSLTFLDPEALNRIFHTSWFDSMDGVYWTLYLEVRFYLIAAILFFSRRGKFAETVFYFAAAVSVIYTASSLLHLPLLHSILSFLVVAYYLPWFLIGISLYLSWSGNDVRYAAILGAFALFASLLNTILGGLNVRTGIAADLLIPLIALAAWRMPIVNRLLSHPWVTNIGIASYSLYLIHNDVGLATIGWLGDTLHWHGASSAILALVVAAAAVAVSFAIFRYWERPLNAWILAKWNVRKVDPLSEGSNPPATASARIG